MATENKALRAENLLLKQKLDALSRRLFGKSSEQLNPNQLQLLLQGLEEPKKHQASSNDETSAPEEEADAARRKKTKAKNHSRIKGLDTLETQEQTLLPAEYEANPDAYEIIGHEVTEFLDYIPARCIRQLIKRVKVRRWLLGICFWRKGRKGQGWASYMGEKGEPPPPDHTPPRQGWASYMGEKGGWLPEVPLNILPRDTFCENRRLRNLRLTGLPSGFGHFSLLCNFTNYDARQYNT